MRIACLIVAAACGSSSTSPDRVPPPPAPVALADAAAVTPDAATLDAAVIARLWPDGCFTIRDASGTTLESDRDRCARPRRPYSTFKVPNALLGVDAGIFDGPEAPMTWDKKAIPDTKQWRDSWRKAHTLRSGIAVSAVPHFRTLALQLGDQRMRDGLAKLAYGNQDTSGGLDLFWLHGGLRISAAQQLAFVDALARGKLAVSARAQEVVREIIKLEERGGAALHGKTGTGPIEDGNGGWLAWQVGWVSRGPTIYPYAVWLEVAPAPADANVDAARAAREARLRATLDELGVFPAKP